MDPADAVIDRVRVERLDDSGAGPWKAGDSRFAIVVEAGGVTGVFAPVDELPAALVATRLGQSALQHPVADHTGLLRRLLAGLGPHAAGLGRWAVGALDCAVWDLHGRLADLPVAALLSDRPAPSAGLRLLALPGPRLHVGPLRHPGGEGGVHLLEGGKRPPGQNVIKTVRKYLAAKGPASPPRRSSNGRHQQRVVDDFAPLIDAMLRAEVLMNERLARDYGFTGNYQRVKLYVQEARPRIAEAPFSARCA